MGTNNLVSSAPSQRASYFSNTWLNISLPFSEQRILLLIGDVLMLTLAGFITMWSQTLFVSQSMVGLVAATNSLFLIWILALIWITSTIVFSCYDLKVSNNRLHITYSLTVSMVGSGMIYVLIAWFFTSVGLQTSPPVLIGSIFLFTVLVLTISWRMAGISLFTSSPLRVRTIILGAGRSGRLLLQLENQPPHCDVMGFVDEDPKVCGTFIEGVPVLGTLDQLVPILQQTGASQVILAINGGLSGDLLKTLMYCYEQGIQIKPMTLFYEEITGRVPVVHLRREWFPVPPWPNVTMPTLHQLGKRGSDILLSSIGLLLVLPFFPIIALLIRLDSPGPIFYRQERLGRGGKIFHITKFRSMVANAEQKGQAVWATRDDPRITRVGKFLRLTRIDELPQLYNVLKGDMSIVGPRPERPQFLEELQEQIPFYRARLSIKPGLTGWAQINYRYGSSIEDTRIKLEYDLYYIKHRSLVLDLIIILRTIKVVVLCKGT